MYPKNAASPQRLAVGAVVQISDGAVQTSAVSIAVIPQGGASGAGGGTTAYDNGIVLYTPTQAETNYASFVVTAYKTGCIPVSVTVVTTASAVSGYAGLDWATINAPTTTVAFTGTTIATTQKVDIETIKTNPVVNAGTVTFPTTATLASTTNITAATGVVLSGVTHTGAVIPTVSTVTNRVTANADQFGGAPVTATTSVTIPAASTLATTTGAVGSVTGAVGSVTGLTAANLDVAVSTRLATAGYTAPLDAAGTRTAVGLASANLDTQLTAIDDYIDTEVAAIKAKTDLIPASPASTTNITSASGITLATGGVGTGDIDSTALNEIADAILDRVMSAGADSGTDTTTGRTVRQALRVLRNKVAIAAGTMTVYKEGDAVASWTSAVTRTAGDPISSNDPT